MVIPVHPQPMQVAVEAFEKAIEWEKGGIGGLAVGEEIGFDFRAAGVAGRDEAF